MRYLTKGELLVALGDSANSFTAFMINPEGFGVTEPSLTMLKVAKQKLDWTNTIDISLAEVNTLVETHVSLGVVSRNDADSVLNTPDRSDADIYMITIRAQDDISLVNTSGALWDGNQWKIVIEYFNKTKGISIVEDNYFSEIPDMVYLQETVTNRIIELKKVY